MNEAFVSHMALDAFLQFEPYFLLGALVLSGWIFYRIFLQDVSLERHRSLKGHYRSLSRHFLVLTMFFASYLLAREAGGGDTANLMTRLTPYFGILAFIWGLIVFVRACRTWVLQYLFLQSMQEGVPLLIVNVLTLMLYIALAFWAGSRLFSLQLAPLLATSAAFSIILGLALQDTLGNLFAGISLQLEKNFEIGDWIEITSGIQKATGQVKEISWRSVLLVGFSDELITIPNRMMSGAQISNFSPPDQPIVRSHTFRLPYGSNWEKAKDILERAAAEVSEVRGLPAPFAYLKETDDSWVVVKLIYFIDSYGAQYGIGDKVMRKAIDALAQNGVELARPELHVRTQEQNGV